MQHTAMQTIAVSDYDPAWPATFERLQSRLWPVVSDVAPAVEHVGSTAVPGLAAKPIIDINVVIRSRANLRSAIRGLATDGYVHLGDLGIEGREAFDSPPGSRGHNLYVCSRGNLALANHLALRDFLRVNPDAAHEYGELKKTLAARFPDDIVSYVEGKTDFILTILQGAGFHSEQLASIERANRGGV